MSYTQVFLYDFMKTKGQCFGVAEGEKLPKLINQSLVII